jgi:phage terminase small subunit
MSDDIVKRLREYEEDGYAAADEIERLRARIAALEEAIQVSINVMARAHNRIHALPRTTDTLLADDIDRALGQARAALNATR